MRTLHQSTKLRGLRRLIRLSRVPVILNRLYRRLSMKISHYILLALLAFLTMGSAYGEGHNKEPHKFHPRGLGGMAATTSSTTGGTTSLHGVATAVFPSTQSVWFSYSAHKKETIYYCSAPDGKPSCQKIIDE
jgi:hypothetical protein